MIIRNCKEHFYLIFWFGTGTFFIGTFILLFQIYFVLSEEKTLQDCMSIIILSLSFIIIDLFVRLFSFLFWIHKYKELIVFKKNKGYIVLNNIVIKSFELSNIQIIPKYPSFIDIIDGIWCGDTILIIAFDDKTITKYELGITRFTFKKIKKYIDRYKK